MSESNSKEIRWLALESNPDVVNKYIHAMGVDEKWMFVDVIGTDPELLEMVPRPAMGVLLLFPITEKVTKAEEEERLKLETEGQITDQKVWFMKQTIGNACGTIGVLHALANIYDKLSLPEDSPLQQFF